MALEKTIESVTTVEKAVVNEFDVTITTSVTGTNLLKSLSINGIKGADGLYISATADGKISMNYNASKPDIILIQELIGEAERIVDSYSVAPEEGE